MLRILQVKNRKSQANLKILTGRFLALMTGPAIHDRIIWI